MEHEPKPFRDFRLDMTSNAPDAVFFSVSFLYLPMSPWWRDGVVISYCLIAEDIGVLEFLRIIPQWSRISDQP